MRTQNPAIIIALARIFARISFPVVHEHSARHVFHSFDANREALLDIGFKVALEDAGKTLFLHQMNTDERIELIPSATPKHEAYAVQTQKEFTQLDFAFHHDQQSEFKPMPGFDVKKAGLEAKMYEHMPTGVIIQIVWREKQIFPNVFEAPKTS